MASKTMQLEKKLLQEADLSLQKCVDTCRTAEKTATQIKSMNLQDEVHALNKSSRKLLKTNAPHKEQRKGEKPHHAGGKTSSRIWETSSHKENLVQLLWISIQEKRKPVRHTVKCVQTAVTRTISYPVTRTISYPSVVNRKREYIC